MAKKEDELKIAGEAVEEKVSIRKTPDVEADFEALLMDYGVAEKTAEVVTKHIADTGSDKVFENPLELLEKLAKFPRQVPPTTRKNILDHWIARNKLPVPETYEQEAEMPTKELRQKKEGKAEAKYAVEIDTGTIRMARQGETPLTYVEAEELQKNIEKKGKTVSYVYDCETDRVRMAKEGEGGGTLDEAKELQRLAHKDARADTKQFDESKFVLTEEGWGIAPGARLTGFEVMTWQTMQRAKERGEAIDPEEAAVAALERAERLRALMGTRGETGIEQMVSLFDKLDEIIQRRMPTRDESADVRNLKDQLTIMQKSLDDMKEQHYKDEIQAIKDSHKQELDTLAGVMTSLNKKIENLEKREPGGMTAYDLMHDAIEGVKSEAAGMRTDVKTVLGSFTRSLPPPLTEEQRAALQGGTEQALQRDENIEELMNRVFSKRPGM